MSDKRPINPAGLCEPIGFAHAYLVESADLATLYLAGQCGFDKEGHIVGPRDFVAQAEQALANIGMILEEAGMAYADVVQLNFFVKSTLDYTVARRELGAIWKRTFAKHFPAMAVFGVTGLYDPQALIEIQGVATR